MPREHEPTVGQLAAPDGAGDWLAFSVSTQGLNGAELQAWLAIDFAREFAHAGGFFMQWGFGGATQWVRFEYRGAMFNRAAFAAVEVLPARDPALLPPGALWLLSEPPNLRSQATS